MIKHFNNNRPRSLLAKPVWPENPKQTPTVFSARKPLRKLRVLVDAELVDPKASEDKLDKATLLLELLHSEVVEFYRYTDGLPPANIEPIDISLLNSPPHPIYAGWAVAYPIEDEHVHWDVIYSADPQKGYSLSWIVGNTTEIARTDESQPVYQEFNPEQRAQMREMDALALQVADHSLHADVFITQRQYLFSGSVLISKPDVTVCTRDEAIPLIALYLRAQGEFILPTGDPTFKYRFNSGLYFWVGARELLPEGWRWFGACVQHSSGSGNNKLELLGGSLLDRVAIALQERDEIYIAINQPTGNDVSDKALRSLDSVLVSLMGAVDVTARVAHYILSIPDKERTSGWQNYGWRKQVKAQASTLAAICDSGTPGDQVLTILRLLRNSVHGVALQGITYHKVGTNPEIRIGLPVDDEIDLLAAMDAMGGRASWGVNSLGMGLNLIKPDILVERLFEEVLTLLNNLMKETPVEKLSDVTITPDNSLLPVNDPETGRPGPFTEQNRLAIRWQLGF